MPARPDPMGAFQARFHQRWQHLRDPDVRALAWLLDAPNLFHHADPRWQGRIAQFPVNHDLDAWLIALDANPLSLKHSVQGQLRLGRYAERLLGFYLQQQGMLVAQGVPVRDGETVGEFDFLWRDGLALVHWELATKFYLFEPGLGSGPQGYFIGPNLADSLDAKMRKVLQRQLKLGQHPAAHLVLPSAISRAEAMVKGWLFYPLGASLPADHAASCGLSEDHCRGFWCPLARARTLSGEQFAILPRRQWLAPALLPRTEGLTPMQLQTQMERYFASDSMPLLIVSLEEAGDQLQEVRRGFIVPDDWQQRALESQPLRR